MYGNWSKKYSALCSKFFVFVCLLRMVYAFLFLYLKDNALFIVASLSTLIYIGLSVATYKKNKIDIFSIICFMEVLLFSSIGSWRFGYMSGFISGILFVVPLMLLVLHLVGHDAKDIMRYVVFCTVSTLITLSVSIVELFPVKTISTIELKCIYTLNLLLGCILLLLFSLLFVKHVMFKEIALKKENKRLENAANYDPLTKLLNRRTFDSYYEKAVTKYQENGQDFTIMMVDIDNFKKVNDTYGHDAGDEVLKNVALILKCVVRPYDTVFRWGGEEMVLLLVADENDAKDVAERCRKRIEDFSMQYDDNMINITVTTGLCTYRPFENKDSLIEKADACLYYGKQHGKNQVVVHKY